MTVRRRLPTDQGSPAGQLPITPADTALDAAIETATAARRDAIRPIAEREATRILGEDVMALARWRGVPNEFFVGRRQFAVAISHAWTAGPDGTPVPFEHPQLFFRAIPANGRRGAGVQDWTAIRSLCELAEVEARASR